MSIYLGWFILCITFAGLSEQRGTWNASGDYEYYVSPVGESKSYDESQQFCQDNGGQLALVKTKAIHDFIASLVQNGSGIPYAFYIGLRHNATAKQYFWTDGSSLDYANWHTNEQYPLDSETCVTMGYPYTYYKELRWYTLLCTKANTGKKGLACQRRSDWHWSQWAEVSTCNCLGLLRRSRHCIGTARANYDPCSEISSENETVSCALPGSCFTTATVEDSATPKAIVDGTVINLATSGMPPFLIAIIVGVSGLLFLIIIISICFVRNRKIKKAHSDAVAEAAGELHSSDAGKTTAVTGQESVELELADVENTDLTESAGYSTLDIEGSAFIHTATKPHKRNKEVELIASENSGRDEPNARAGQMYATVLPKSQRAVRSVELRQIGSRDATVGQPFASVTSERQRPTQEVKPCQRRVSVTGTKGQMYASATLKKQRSNEKVKSGQPEDREIEDAISTINNLLTDLKNMTQSDEV